MNSRTIRRIIKAEPVNMGGHLLDQPLPARGVDMIDPFLLIHHWDHPLAGGQRPQEVGVGPHPHRGFSPVTFVFKGSVQHRDSLGNNAIVQAGGTQWMHAGRGITHSERPSADLAKNGGENEFIYILNGKLSTDNNEVGTKDLIWFNNNEENIEINILKQTRFIVLAGKPINEPVASYGPFIMNNQTEIMEAIRDAQMGKMGVLIEEF